MARISDAELIVMEIIWRKKETNLREIISECKKIGMTWDDNTIRTLISRLVNKKFVGISNKIGKEYRYVSLTDESKYKAKQIREFINQFYNGSFVDFMKCAMEQFSVDYSELRQIIIEALQKKEE